MNDNGTARKAVDVPVIRISYTQALEETRQLSLETYIGNDASPQELNALLDKLRRAAERQRAAANLPALNRKVKNLYDGIERAIQDIDRINGEIEQSAAVSPKRNAQASNAQKADKEKAMVTVQRWREEIEKAQVEAAEALMLINAGETEE